jgi:hypothetical protein
VQIQIARRPISAVAKPSSQPPRLHSDMIWHGRDCRAGMAAKNAAQCFFSCCSMSASAGTTSGKRRPDTPIWAPQMRIAPYSPA